MGTSPRSIVLLVRAGLWMALTSLSGCTDTEVLGPGVQDSGRAYSSQGPPVPAPGQGMDPTGDE